MNAMTNRQVLAYDGPNRLLTGIEKQRRFVLRVLSAKRPCPNCGSAHDVFEVTGVDIDAYDLMRSDNPDHGHCPACKSGLQLVVPLQADPHWQKVHA